MADVLRFEELEVGAVALQHQGPAEPGGQHRPALGVALEDAQVDHRRLLEPLGQLQADVAAADDRHLHAAAGAARVDQRLDRLHRVGRAHHDHLVAGLQLGGAAWHEHAAAALDGDDQRSARQVQAAERGRGQRRAGFELVFEQPHHAAGDHLGVDGAGRGDDALDVGGELRLGPDDAVDAEGAEAAVTRGADEVGARHQADRVGLAQPAGQGAGHDVDLVETGGGDEDVGAGDVGAGEHLGAGAAAGDELDVDRLEDVGDVGLVIDDDHFVLGGQGPGERRADLSAADDHDPHERARVARRGQAIRGGETGTAQRTLVS